MLPNGGGKSIFYQLPALFEGRGVTVAVSWSAEEDWRKANEVGLTAYSSRSASTPDCQPATNCWVISEVKGAIFVYVTPTDICSSEDLHGTRPFCTGTKSTFSAALLWTMPTIWQ